MAGRGSALYAVDTRSWRIRKLLDRPGDVFAGPPGMVAFVEHTQNVPGQPVTLINTHDNTIALLDTLDIYERGLSTLDRQGLVFHPSQAIFYSVDNRMRLFAYDYKRRVLVHIYASTGNFPLRNMTIGRDGRHMYVAGGPVLDLEQDSVVAWVGGDIRGSVGLSPSGDTLYVSDPSGGGINIEEIPKGKLFLFDTRTHTYMGAIDVVEKDNPVYAFDRRPTAQFAITPNGRTAYVSAVWGEVFVLNLVSGVIDDILTPPPTENTPFPYTVPLTLGPKP